MINPPSKQHCCMRLAQQHIHTHSTERWRMGHARVPNHLRRKCASFPAGPVSRAARVSWLMWDVHNELDKLPKDEVRDTACTRAASEAVF